MLLPPAGPGGKIGDVPGVFAGPAIGSSNVRLIKERHGFAILVPLLA